MQSIGGSLKALVASAILLSTGCGQSNVTSKAKIEGAGPKEAIVGKPYSTTLRVVGGEGKFAPCNPADARYKLTPEGELSWVPAVPGTEKICVRASGPGTHARLEWEVAVGWAKGESPEELAARLEGWRVEVGKLVSAGASQPVGACPATVIDELKAAKRGPPVLFAPDLVAGQLKPSMLESWRPTALQLQSTLLRLVHVEEVEKARYLLAISTATYVEPQMMLDKRFEGGRLTGRVALVDATKKATLCAATLTFQSSEKVMDYDSGQGGDTDLSSDFVDRGTAALRAAVEKLLPGVPADLPNLPERLRVAPKAP